MLRHNQEQNACVGQAGIAGRLVCRRRNRAARAFDRVAEVEWDACGHAIKRTVTQISGESRSERELVVSVRVTPERPDRREQPKRRGEEDGGQKEMPPGPDRGMESAHSGNSYVAAGA